MGSLPAPTYDRTLNVNLPRRFDSKAHVPIRRNSPRRGSLREWLYIQYRDLSSSRLS